ncbi:MAG: histidine phosphatase family protein [Patescibacteria group bacterium]
MSNSFKIYLARHGQDQDNAAGILNGHRDKTLTIVGIEQANILAKTIEENGLGITKIYSSPLQRAYKTAEIVADYLNIENPTKLDLLIERNFGIMTGKLVKDIEKLCAPNILKADPITYFISVENSETFPQMVKRAKKLLKWIKKNHATENILLVSHGDIGKMIYAAFYNLNWKEVLTKFHFGNSEVLLLLENSKPDERHVHKVKQHNH